MATVTKKDLVAAVATKTGMDEAVISETVNSLLDAICNKLKQGDNIALRRFGSFTIRVAKAKKGRNPHRPEVQIHIPERCTLDFTPSMDLKSGIGALKPAQYTRRKSNRLIEVSA